MQSHNSKNSELISLSKPAMDMIESFLHFKFGSAVCSVPYFNNKVTRRRVSLSVNVGKGSPSAILEEVKAYFIKNRIDPSKLNSQSLKKALVDERLGIDCSGFAFHALNQENLSRNSQSISSILFYPYMSFIGRIWAKKTPERHTDVLTLGHDKNSRTINLDEARPGDFITMISLPKENRNHLLLIHRVEYDHSGMPKEIHYSHSIAYPEDGPYGSGIRQGIIEIKDRNLGLLEQRWVENGNESDRNHIFIRAKNSTTQLRRLLAFDHA